MRRLVVAVVAVVVALFAAVFFAPLALRLRETARRAECLDHLRHLAAFALADYRAGHAEALPPGTLPEAFALPPEKRLSLYADLMPQYGRPGVSGSLARAEFWDAPANADAVAAVVPKLLCPSLVADVGVRRPGEAHYVGVAGLGADAPEKAVNDAGAGAFRWTQADRLRATRYFEAANGGGWVAEGDRPGDPVRLRGLAFTAAAIESDSGVGPWAAGGPGTVRGWDPSAWPLLGPGRPFGSRHVGGSNLAFLDGSARFVTAGVSRDVFATWATLAEVPVGELVP